MFLESERLPANWLCAETGAGWGLWRTRGLFYFTAPLKDRKLVFIPEFSENKTILAGVGLLLQPLLHHLEWVRLVEALPHFQSNSSSCIDCSAASHTPALATSPQFVLGNSCFILLHRNTSPKMLKHFGCHATGTWTEIHLIEHVLISCSGRFIGFSLISCCQSCWGSATAGCRHPVCLRKYTPTWDDASVQSKHVPPRSL